MAGSKESRQERGEVIDQPSILDTARRENIEVAKRGRYHVTGCANHSPDRNPSFVLYGAKGYCHVCHWSADSIGFVMKLHGLTFKDALAYLGIEKRQTPADSHAAAEARQERERKAALVERFRAWEQTEVNRLSSLLRALRSMRARALEVGGLETSAELQGEIDELEYHYEIFCRKDDEPKFRAYQEMTDAGN